MAIDKDLDFTGKTILVTGSGRNIGRAIVLEFAARGANVIINSRANEAEARHVEQEAQALGAKTLVVMGTVGELQTVEEMKRRAEDKFGRGRHLRIQCRAVAYINLSSTPRTRIGTSFSTSS